MAMGRRLARPMAGFVAPRIAISLCVMARSYLPITGR
jgi:hypothetical protein